MLIHINIFLAIYFVINCFIAGTQFQEEKNEVPWRGHGFSDWVLFAVWMGILLFAGFVLIIVDAIINYVKNKRIGKNKNHPLNLKYPGK